MTAFLFLRSVRRRGVAQEAFEATYRTLLLHQRFEVAERPTALALGLGEQDLGPCEVVARLQQ